MTREIMIVVDMYEMYQHNVLKDVDKLKARLSYNPNTFMYEYIISKCVWDDYMSRRPIPIYRIMI